MVRLLLSSSDIFLNPETSALTKLIWISPFSRLKTLVTPQSWRRRSAVLESGRTEWCRRALLPQYVTWLTLDHTTLRFSPKRVGWKPPCYICIFPFLETNHTTLYRWIYTLLFSLNNIYWRYFISMHVNLSLFNDFIILYGRTMFYPMFKMFSVFWYYTILAVKIFVDVWEYYL